MRWCFELSFMVLRCGNVGLSIAMCTSFYIEAFDIIVGCTLSSLMCPDLLPNCHYRDGTYDQSRDQMICNLHLVGRSHFNFFIIKTQGSDLYTLSYLSSKEQMSARYGWARCKSLESKPLFSCVVFWQAQIVEGWYDLYRWEWRLGRICEYSLLRSTVVRISVIHALAVKSQVSNYVDDQKVAQLGWVYALT